MSTLRTWLLGFIGMTFIIGSAAILGLNARRTNESCYNVAMEYYNKGEYETAKNLFTHCYSFRDSIYYIVECNQKLDIPCVVCDHCRSIIYLDISAEWTDLESAVVYYRTTGVSNEQ